MQFKTANPGHADDIFNLVNDAAAMEMDPLLEELSDLTLAQYELRGHHHLVLEPCDLLRQL